MSEHYVDDQHKSNRLVSPYGEPKSSEPHYGHAGTSFEGNDAKASLVIWSLAIIGGMLVFVFALTVGIQKYLEKANPVGELPSPLAPARVLPPAPQLQVHPWEELPDVRADEDRVLSSFGKDPDGRVHVPIDRAMDAVVAHLKVQPDAGQGITTPGGEGRDFAGSVNAMPQPYQRPQIQGEIRKNAR
jgi:hypothetical protein